MASFKTSRFQIELPNGFVDVSTYAFVLPRNFALPGELASFNPSVVIKFDPQPPPVDLVKYVVTQRSTLRESVGNLEIIHEQTGARGRSQTMTTTFEWGPEGPTRLRQKQYFLLLPAASVVCSMTATELATIYNQSELLFDRIFDSLIPEDV
jgi:hypothetical protein